MAPIPDSSQNTDLSRIRQISGLEPYLTLGIEDLTEKPYSLAAAVSAMGNIDSLDRIVFDGGLRVRASFASNGGTSTTMMLSKAVLHKSYQDGLCVHEPTLADVDENDCQSLHFDSPRSAEGTYLISFALGYNQWFAKDKPTRELIFKTTDSARVSLIAAPESRIYVVTSCSLPAAERLRDSHLIKDISELHGLRFNERDAPHAPAYAVHCEASDPESSAILILGRVSSGYSCRIFFDHDIDAAKIEASLGAVPGLQVVDDREVSSIVGIQSIRSYELIAQRAEIYPYVVKLLEIARSEE